MNPALTTYPLPVPGYEPPHTFCHTEEVYFNAICALCEPEWQ